MFIKIFNTLKIFLLSLIVLLSAGYMSTTVIHAQTVPMTKDNSWQIGSTQKVTWDKASFPSDAVGNITVTGTINGKEKTYYIAPGYSITQNTGSYPWKVGTVYSMVKTADCIFSNVESCFVETTIGKSVTPYVLNINLGSNAAVTANAITFYIIDPIVVTPTGPGTTTTTTTTTSTTPTPGCTGGNLFDPITGKSCSVVTLPQGCAVGDLFNGKTGKPCVAGVTPINPVTPGCPVGALYNGITGKPCVAGVHSVTSPQNISTNTSTSYYNFGTLILKRGNSGIAVTELQRFLNDKESFSLVLDGKFGPKTQTAVIQFQQQNGLKPDGIAGPKTKAKMNTVL